MPSVDPEARREYSRRSSVKWKLNNPDKVKEQKRRYHHRRGKHVARERRYGITQERFESMMRGQNNRCGICSRKFDDSLIPCVDHDHATGVVRGLLCLHCNRTLGAFDSINWLIKALEYLR